MATGGSRFDDKEYINWLRATLSLIYIKEGLEEFTTNQSELFHQKLLQLYGSTTHTCKGLCSSTDIKKDFRNKRWHMSCSACMVWLQNAITFHRMAPFPNLSTGNTDPRKWCTDPWETAKLYMPYGCEKHKSASDADIQGILSLFINCKHFFNARHIGRKELIEKLLGIRNALFHSATFKVSDTDVQDHLQTASLFLGGMSGLTTSERDSLQEAIEKIKQLQTNQIELSMNKELELRTLQQRQVILDGELMSLQKEQDRQSTKGKHQRETLKEVKIAKDRFYEFLEQNDLLNDMAKLSKRLTNIDDRVQAMEQKLQTHAEKDADRVNDLQAECGELQSHLVHVYGKRIFWENPMTAEELYLSKMYVQPSVKRIREINTYGELAEVENQVGQPSKLTYKRVFMCETGACENIYISGDAGVGKTTFCNQLVLNWCNAVQNIKTETVTSDDLRVLASFRFLFCINLRETETMYHFKDMIQEQLLTNASVSLNISEILKIEKCLIVLDGLDEWTCPDNVKKCPDINKHIPGRNTSNKNCVFLTTTRNWKYDVIALKNRDVDKHVELSGIDKESLEQLSQKMIDYLNRQSQTLKHIGDFYKDVAQKRLNSFLTFPVLLIQLMTLWHAGKDFGNSQLQLYCRMLELLFERSEKNLPEPSSQCLSTTVAKPIKLPGCFSSNGSCQKHAQLLLCLAKLAYKALFNKQKEEALVFKSSIMEICGISPSEIKLCLECGILSQSKDYGNYTGRYKKFSFFHKKVQEFLGALFIVTNDTDGGLLKEVKQFCDSVDIMLEMNQVWLFMAGMKPGLTIQLFEHLGDVVSADVRVEKYRQTLDSDRFEDRLKEDIQETVFDGVTEGISNGRNYANVCIEDLHVIDCTVRDVERLLPFIDIFKVKSVYIRPGGTMDAEWAAIGAQFLHCHSLQKLYLDELLLPGSIKPFALADLIDSNYDSLTSLDILIQIQATYKLVNAICSSISKRLMALRLYGVKLTHEQTNQILNSLSQSACISQLELALYCTDSVKQVRISLDWSAMTQLREVTLSNMFVDNLQSLPNCVESVVLSRVTMPMIILRDFARGLTQTRRHVTVNLDRVALTERKVEWGPLAAFLYRCPGLKFTECEYYDRSDTWNVVFHTDR